MADFILQFSPPVQATENEGYEVMGPGWGREGGEGHPGTCQVLPGHIQATVSPAVPGSSGPLTFSQHQHLLRTLFVSLVLGRVIALSALEAQQGCIPATVRKGSLREACYLSEEQEKKSSPRNIFLVLIFREKGKHRSLAFLTYLDWGSNVQPRYVP